MNKPQKPYKDALGSFYGGPKLTLVAIASGFLLSGLTALVSSIAVDNAYPGADYQWRADQLFGIQAFIAAIATIVGTILRALSHNRTSRKNMDYLGKLFAVGALGFVLLAAQAKIAPQIYSPISSWFATGLGVLMIFLVPFLWSKGELKKDDDLPNG